MGEIRRPYTRMSGLREGYAQQNSQQVKLKHILGICHFLDNCFGANIRDYSVGHIIYIYYCVLLSHALHRIGRGYCVGVFRISLRFVLFVEFLKY